MKSRMFRVLLCVFLFVSFTFFPATAASDIKRVAVLSFKNLAKDTSLDWIGEGFGETLTTKLINVKSLMLIERLQIEKILQEQKLQLSGLVDEKSAVKAGKILGIEYAVIGSFQKIESQLKADTRLISVESGQVIAADDIKGPYETTFDLQEQLALKLAKSLDVSLTPIERTQIAKTPAKSQAAYEWYAKGVDYHRKGDRSKAIESFTKAIDSDPSFARAYSMRAFTQGIGWDNPKKIADVEKAIALAPADPFVHKIKMWIYLLNGEMVIQIANKIVSLDPEDADAQLALAQAYQRKGKLENPDYNPTALEYYNKAIELRPDFGAAYWDRGMFYALNLKKSAAALTDFNKACTLGNLKGCDEARDAEKEASGPEGEYKAHVEKGIQLHDGQKNYEDAVREYTQAIAINPVKSRPYYLRGVSHYAMKNRQKAIEDYSSAISISGSDFNIAYAYSNRAVCYLELGDYPKAIEGFRKGCELEDKDACINELRARGRQLIEKNPGLEQEVDGLVKQAGDYIDNGENQKAIETASRTIEKLPSSFGSYWLRGMAYRKIGNCAQGIEDLDIAVWSNAFRGGHAHAERGLCRKFLGDKNGAITDLNEACRRGKQDACKVLNE